MFRLTLVLLGLLLLPVTEAAAQKKVSFVVLPFAVQGSSSYAYLERSLPQMFNSRIYWSGRVEPAVQDLPASVRPVLDQATAAKLRDQYKADYAIWGTVTVVGDDCSLDVWVMDKAGKVTPQARSAKAPQLMSAVTAVCDGINRDVFGRTRSASSAGSPQPATGRAAINQMNPEIMMNQTTPGEVYLNPQFRYSGTSAQDDSRKRAPALNFSSVGMEVADVTGDGRNEVLLLSDHLLTAYRFENGQLRKLGEFKIPLTRQALSIRSLPRSSGRAWIIVNAIDQKSMPQAYILTFDGTNFKEEMRNIKYFLNVVKLPPNYAPVLIGQEAGPPKIFKTGVNVMVRKGDSLVPERRLNLPTEANVFGFTYLPAARAEPGADRLVVLTSRETLRLYGKNNSPMAVTNEKFSGAAVGLEMNAALPGFGDDSVVMGQMFYIPIRMLAADLEQDGTWELLVNKPISTASQIFERYRFFPQSEIHCLFWDGTGLSLQWKTRRIKGSMVDFALADGDNDGVLDLVVCINTHPGALGVQARKTTVILYPLDTSRIDPNTPPDKTEYYDD
ncbi:VCBS repeat-containing protein [Desulfovibrio sp. OttesenSCG-928-A18]|nr:VCBS repeat-containing protein [Desulfovibrio sp. OttesenSCG-928-A18]